MADEACPEDDALSRFAEDALGSAERIAVESHVGGCATCTQLLASFRDTFGADLRALGRYEIVRQLGEGGMGVVYEARDPVLGRRVAVKVLRARDRLEDPVDEAPAEERRLLREARAMARVTDPNVVTVFDAGVEDGRVFLAMELVRGPHLRAHLAHEKELGPDARLALMCRAGRGLAAAHRASVVHRDFKPENVLVGTSGPRVTDFGLARPASTLPDDAPTSADARWMADPATAGNHGTPAYMAPEQIDGAEVTALSDQFAFAVATYEAVFLAHPFGLWSEDAPATLRDLRAAMDRGPRRPAWLHGLPQVVFDVLARGLSVAPADRFPTMDAFVAALGATFAPADDPHRKERDRRTVSALYAMFGVHLCFAVFTVLALFSDGDSAEKISVLETIVATAMFTGLPAALFAFLGARALAKGSSLATAFLIGYVLVGFVSVAGIPVAIYVFLGLREARARAHAAPFASPSAVPTREQRTVDARAA